MLCSSFFSVEEVFVRLGQNRLKGCLLAFNKRDSFHIFVDNGSTICVLGDKLQGEPALAQALHLPEASYAWLDGVDPIVKNLDVNINEYALKNAIAKDTQIGRTMMLPKQETKILPKEELAKKLSRKEINLDFLYYFTDEIQPTVKLRLTKISHLVGRGEECDLVLHNPEVSRRHCIMEITERGVMIKDLDSTNGTFVNGIALVDGYISRGDRLRLGAYELTLHVERKLGGRFVS